MKFWLASLFMITTQLQAKTFTNSYVAFEVPDTWSCLQEGVAWTCTPKNPIDAKEAIIMLVAKVAGPEDNLNSFLNYLKKPKTITTRVGTPMPSQVMYAQPRTLAGTQWIQAQHLGSETQEYYTLYLATVKEQLAILVTFSAERNRYQKYNPVFDRAMKTLKIVANQQLLFPKSETRPGSDVIGINVHPAEDMIDHMPPAAKTSSRPKTLVILGVLAVLIFGGAVYFTRKRKKISPTKSRKSRTQ